jgi:hypothetical protein
MTVMSVFYEGMILRWLSFVGILILLTDIAFVITTIAGAIYYRKQKILFYCHLFSVLVILTGIVITIIYGKGMPKLLFTLWEFYILYFYGVILIRKIWNFKYITNNNSL